jgi:hypothetical protein
MDAPMDESEQYRLRYQGYDLAAFDTLSVELYRSDVEHLMDNYSNRPLDGAGGAARAVALGDDRRARVIGEILADSGVRLDPGSSTSRAGSAPRRASWVLIPTTWTR